MVSASLLLVTGDEAGVLARLTDSVVDVVLQEITLKMSAPVATDRTRLFKLTVTDSKLSKR